MLRPNPIQLMTGAAIIMFIGFFVPWDLAATGRSLYVIHQSHVKVVDSLTKCSAPNSLNYSGHGFTMRPLEEFVYYQPAFLSFLSTLDAVRDGVVLEIGCGSGRALIELKSKYPTMNIIGSNLRGYGFAQTNGSLNELWGIATHFDMVVYCTPDRKPLFPRIIETDKIQSPLFAASFADQKFDFIFSRHALNQGKLLSKEAAVSIPRVLPLLKDGGLAMLHLLLVKFENSTELLYYHILSVHNLLLPDSASPTAPPQRVSVIVYNSVCGNKWYICISLVLRRCPPGAALHPHFKDCIIPHSLDYTTPSREWAGEELARAASLPPDPKNVQSSSRFHYEQGYAAEYLQELMSALKGWEDEGLPPLL